MTDVTPVRPAVLPTAIVVVIPTLFTIPSEPSVAVSDLTARDRALPLGNTLAFLGFVPLVAAARA